MGRRIFNTDSSLRGYVARTLPGRHAILVSNRGPQDSREDGTFKRGAGGVVTALLTLAEATAADWVACARNDVERKQAESSSDGLQVRLARGKGRLYYAAPSREEYDRYYSVIANPVLCCESDALVHPALSLGSRQRARHRRSDPPGMDRRLRPREHADGRKGD